MNPEKVGILIKEIRTTNHLTQAEFAKEFGVTYQAVSKWENGKNLPDIEILKTICEKYNKDINEFLVGNLVSKKKKNFFSVLVLTFFLVCILIFLLFFHNKDDFEFRTLSSECEHFNLYGSIAYNQNKSSIYISNIEYCGEENKELYEKIECSLYEVNQNTKTKISTCDYQNNQTIRLEEFLKDVQIHVDNYMKSCKEYTENSLYLEINATDKNGKITAYKIPLSLKDTCSH